MSCKQASNPIKPQGDKICDFQKSGGEGKRAISEIGGWQLPRIFIECDVPVY